jgi:hypothetical protein
MADPGRAGGDGEDGKGEWLIVVDPFLDGGADEPEWDALEQHA